MTYSTGSSRQDDRRCNPHETIDVENIQVEETIIRDDSNTEIEQNGMEPHNAEEFYMGPLTSSGINKDDNPT